MARGVVSPTVEKPEALQEVIRRVRIDAGKLEAVSLLLPDSWFRINIIDISSLPEKKAEADEVVRWALKRTLPIRPEDLRMSYQAVSRDGEKARVLIVAALQKTLTTIERAFAAEGVDVVLIEPLGLNVWNAIAVREAATTGDRLFFFLRNGDFTTALFRAGIPLFLRSRRLTGERTMDQEIRLSASYLRNNIDSTSVETCWFAGEGGASSLDRLIKEEFDAPVKRLSLEDVAVAAPGIDTDAFESELTGCTGVFTA